MFSTQEGNGDSEGQSFRGWLHLLITLILALSFLSVHLLLIRRYHLFFFYGEDNESWAANIWTLYRSGITPYFLELRNRLSLHTFLSIPLTLLFSGNPLTGGRILSILSSCLVVAIYFPLMRRHAGFIATLLSSLILVTLARFHLATVSFTPQSLLLLSQFLLLFSGLREVVQSGRRRFLLPGLLTGLTIFVNDQGFFYIPVFLCLIPFLREKGDAPLFSIRRAGWYISGLLLIAIPYLCIGSLFFTRFANMKLTRTIREHYRYLVKGEDVQFMEKTGYERMKRGEAPSPGTVGGLKRAGHQLRFTASRLGHYFMSGEMRSYLSLLAAVFALLPFLIFHLIRRGERGALSYLLLLFLPIFIYLFTYWEKRHLDFFLPSLFLLLPLTIEGIRDISRGKTLLRAILALLLFIPVLLFSRSSLKNTAGQFERIEREENPKFCLILKGGEWIRRRVPEGEMICSFTPYYSIFGTRGEVPYCQSRLMEGKWEEIPALAGQEGVYLVLDNLSPLFDFPLLEGGAPPEGATLEFMIESADGKGRVAVFRQRSNGGM